MNPRRSLGRCNIPFVIAGLDPAIHGTLQRAELAWMRGSTPRKTT
jgi:hypothetical protein